MNKKIQEIKSYVIKSLFQKTKDMHRKAYKLEEELAEKIMEKTGLDYNSVVDLISDHACNTPTSFEDFWKDILKEQKKKKGVETKWK